ncbi:WxL domain-containing protein [Lactobacillus sp. CC-MHH1034]|uniref:WxL domain-containing protein n=1 Tax=Agrilactobacillus fermenti TaxID=2586909 RepID=UPI001E56740C|nr:WxL domain-containing protein [Agrilactobacillus fermenti]MCD2256937.1 WxL domain-containing protein [Agrilactobacillus fermenti]
MKIRKLSLFSSVLILSSLVLPVTKALGAGTDPRSALNGVVPAGEESGSARLSDNDAVVPTDGSASGISQLGIGFDYSKYPGNLALNFVPNFDFGLGNAISNSDTSTSTPITLGTKLPLAAAGSKSGPGRNLVVTDARTDQAANAQGYNLTLALKSFKAVNSQGQLDTSNATYLNHAVLSFDASNIKVGPGTYSSQGDGTFSYAGTSDHAPTLQSDLSVSPGGEMKVLAADQGQGTGTWGVDFSKNESAHLFVPITDQDKGHYVARMDWSLGSGPFS